MNQMSRSALDGDSVEVRCPVEGKRIENDEERKKNNKESERDIFYFFILVLFFLFIFISISFIIHLPRGQRFDTHK